MVYVFAINGDSALLQIIEARQEVYDGTFTGAGRAYNGYSLPRLRCQGYIMKHVFIFFIGKGYILIFHVTNDFRQFYGIRRLIHLWAGVHDLKYPLGGGHR